MIGEGKKLKSWSQFKSLKQQLDSSIFHRHQCELVDNNNNDYYNDDQDDVDNDDDDDDKGWGWLLSQLTPTFYSMGGSS